MALNTTFSTGAVLTSTQMNNLPFGLVANATRTTAQTGIGVLTDLTGLSVTFTAIANRQYLMMATLNPYGTANEFCDVQFAVNGSTSRYFRQYFPSISNNVFTTFQMQAMFTAAAGSCTAKLAMAKGSTNNVNNYADGSFSCNIAVYDLGER